MPRRSQLLYVPNSSNKKTLIRKYPLSGSTQHARQSPRINPNNVAESEVEPISLVPYGVWRKIQTPFVVADEEYRAKIHRQSDECRT